jgi:uncharacterized protein YkwD
MRAMSGESPRLGRTSLVLAAFIAAFAALAVGPVAHPEPVSAGTAANMESKILGWINDARDNRGLRPLRVTDKLRDLAGDRASTLARTGDLDHPECLSCLLRNRGISFDRCAEAIGMTTYPWGHDAARSLFTAWRGSPGHWDILMSRNLKRIGIGVAYRNSGNSTWGAAVLAG